MLRFKPVLLHSRNTVR